MKRLAKPIATGNRTAGGRPAHVWIAAATTAFNCEGIGNPFDDAPRYAPRHRDIDAGEAFMRKLWETYEKHEFSTRHCVACGRWIEEDSRP